MSVKAHYIWNNSVGKRSFMETRLDIEPEPRILFTSPWDPVVVRRGDALGLRALADVFGDAIAPELSNRVRDGRWVTILAWCLARSQEVFHESGGRSVRTRAEQRIRYAWLRPIELMWIARTIAVADSDWRDRSLAGQRRVRRWYQDDGMLTPRFGMSEDQFRAYRQTGMYGGYRVAFRAWPSMTVLGDGWTPGKGAIDLAEWLDKRLTAARPPWLLHAADGERRGFPTPNNRSIGKEHEWWLRQWAKFAQGGRTADQNTLPRRRDDFTILPEANLLEPCVFGDDQNGRRRRNTARAVEKASGHSHLEVCEHLGEVFAYEPIFTLLPRFSRLADAGMATMDLLAMSLQNNSRIDLTEVAARPEAKGLCRELTTAAREWQSSAQIQLRHIETAHRFAAAIPSERPIECLRAVLQYHEMYGGGLRWFILRDNWIETRTPWRGGSSRYRFRLWSLCRLATQCGVLRNMPQALIEDSESDDGENGEGANE